MTWLFTLLAVAVIAVAAGVVTGRISGGMAPAPSSSPFRGLPPEGFVPADLEGLRFTPVLRGYRMDEVDQVLDQVGDQLRRRDAEIDRLNALLRGETLDDQGPEADGGTAGDVVLEGAGSPFERPTSAPADLPADLPAGRPAGLSADVAVPPPPPQAAESVVAGPSAAESLPPQKPSGRF